jgi:hypothetical protein
MTRHDEDLIGDERDGMRDDVISVRRCDRQHVVLGDLAQDASVRRECVAFPLERRRHRVDTEDLSVCVRP